MPSNNKGKEPRLRTLSRRKQSELIDDEVLRARVRKAIEEKKPESWARRFLLHPLTAAAVTFLLTGLAGAYVSHYYNEKLKTLEFGFSEQQRKMDFEREQHQEAIRNIRAGAEAEAAYQRALNQQKLQNAQEEHIHALDHQRTILREVMEREGNFSIELVKNRVNAISEVWENIYPYEEQFKEAETKFQKLVEAKLKRYMDKNYQPKLTDPFDYQVLLISRYPLRLSPAIKQKFIKRIVAASLAPEAKEIYSASSESFQKLSNQVNKNRFWLGEDNYKNVSEYISATRAYITESASEVDTKDEKALAAREAKLQELAYKRDKFRQSVIDISKRLLKEQ